MLKIIKVRGGSMEPTLASGDYLICTKARALRPGFVVVAEHSKYGVIIKRVTSITADTVSLEGDSLESTTTEELGEISLSLVTYRARWAIKPRPRGFKRL